MNRRDLLLNEMNISQWVLRNPLVLKGNALIRLSESVKLIVICEDNYQQTKLFNDILFALELTPNEIQWLNKEQALRINFEHNPYFWIIQSGEQADFLMKKFAKYSVWNTENWQILAQPQYKRQFWNEIQQFLVR